MIMKNEPFVGVRASAESGVRPTSHESTSGSGTCESFTVYVTCAPRVAYIFFLYIHNMLHATVEYKAVCASLHFGS